MANNQAHCWRIPRGFRLHLRTWDDETIAFHEGTGDVHLVGPVESAVLNRLQASPADIETLTGNVARELDVPPDQRLRGHLEDLIGEFCKLGLIEQDRT